MLTPNRPDATCLIAERRESPFGVVCNAPVLAAALARVRLAAEAVHRDRERLVHLAPERAERHRPGREALDDLRGGLDLLERNAAVAGKVEVEQPAQCRLARGVLVHELRVLLVGRVAAGAHGVLKERDRLRVPLVVLAVAAPRIDATERQHPAVRGIRSRVPEERLAREDL